MIKPKCLSDLIIESGLTEDDLKKSMKSEHCDKIAIEVGQDWENLATFIGFGKWEISDIKEEYHSQGPKARRKALIRMWKEKYGNDATYEKMIDGLEKIENRELTEFVISLCKENKLCSQSENTESNVDIVVKTGMQKQHNTKTDCISKVVLSLVMILMYLLFTCGFTIIIDTYRDAPITLLGTPHDSAMDLWLSKLPNSTNCSQQVGHDLPLLYGYFVGRENDIREVISKVKETNILNINGAPAFGKSTLAIYAGHRLVEDCMSVRYINVEELSHKELSGFTNQFERKLEWRRANKFNKQTAALTSTTTTINSGSLPEMKVDSMNSESESNYVQKLKRWSKAINHTTVLILDNTDTILAGSLRIKFKNLITFLIHNSKLHLHVVVVSREKMLFLENFDWWTIRELSQQASVELLNELAPGIASNQVIRIAELLQGHPLALKIIGSILHIYGKDSIPELESELQNQPINVLDRVDSDNHGSFSFMMHLILNQLEFFRKCGHTLSVSLFPGSFSREAGMEILSSKKCLEVLEKHSLLDEYYLGYQHRYKMHRLIREYLQEKIKHSDKSLFVKQFCKYYVQFLLQHAKENELSDTDEHILLSESKNIELLEELLLSTTHRYFSTEELAVIAFLVSKGYTQMEKIQSMFKLYLKNSHYVCQLLDPTICGWLISEIVKHFYLICKCDNTTEFFQKVFEVPCMDIFDCKTILNITRMQFNLNISQQQEAFLYHIETFQCLYIDKFLSHILSTYTYFIDLLMTTYVSLIIITSIALLLILWDNRGQFNVISLYIIMLLYQIIPSRNKLYKYIMYVLCTHVILLLLVDIIFISRPDSLLIIEVGTKILCPISSVVLPIILIFVYKWCYYLHPSFYFQISPPHWINYAVILIFSMLLLLFYYFLFSVCSQLPICH